MSLKIELPFLPTSTNRCYYTDFKSHSRHKSSDYRRFIKDCLPYMPKEKIEGEVSIEYNFYYSLWYKNGNRRKKDKNNFIKAMEDTLVYYGLIEDDCWVRRSVIESYEGEPHTVIKIDRFVEPNV